MKAKKNYALISVILLLVACGGGGGGASVARTAITGTVTPPVAPSSGTTYASLDMLVPPNSTGQWSTVSQSMDYTFDSAAAAATPSALKVTSLNIKPVDLFGYLQITTGAAYPTDATLGQTVSITNWSATGADVLSTATGATALASTIAGLPTANLVNNLTNVNMSAYVMPYSATLNPTGYTYQTFGSWLVSIVGTKVFSENFFSAGVIAVPGTLPVGGTASYIGQVTGSFVDAGTRDLSDVISAMNATADFGARTVAFSTTGTTSRSVNALVGTPYALTPGLDLSGSLGYAAGSNTFTGAVTTTNGMSGNATGRFYGPGIAVATPAKVVGAPPEIGGTFAVMGTVGAMQGAFGGK